MKKILMIILILVLPVLSHSQQIGGIGVGWTGYTGDDDNLDYIKNNGFCLVGIVPVHIPKIDVGIKLKLVHFSNNGKYPLLKDIRFANVSNELLLGKKFMVGKIGILPQLGYGIRAESIYTRWDIGVFALDTFGDLSLWLNRNYKTLGLGLLIDYELDLKAMDKSQKSGRRFNLIFVISK